MTDVPLPAQGSVNPAEQMPWYGEQEDASDLLRRLVVAPVVVADGVTDDRAAIQAALNSLPATGGTVWLPGLCNIGSGGTSGGAPFGLVVPRDNVTLIGAPGAGLVSSVIGIRLLLLSGWAKTSSTDPLDTTNWLTSPLPMPVSPIAEGATSITFTNSSDAATLAAGDLIFIRTGQLVDTALSREPDSELNEVASVAGSVVTLKHPTAKAYAQEYYITGSTGFTSTAVTANPAPFGVVRATGRVLRNVTVRGLKLWQRGSTSATTTAVHMQGAWGVTIEDCDVEHGKYGISGRYARQVRITRSNLHTHGASADNDPAWIGPSTGCSDWVVTSCRGSGATAAKLHSHEGIADLTYVDWRSCTPNSAGQNGASNISVRARAYRHVYDLDMTGSYTTTSTDMLRVTGEVSGDPGSVHFRRLRLRGAPGRAHLYIESPAVSIDPHALDLPSGVAVTVTGGADPLNQSFAVPPGSMSSVAGTPTLEAITTGASGTAWLLDAGVNESVSTSLSIPSRWRLWQIEVQSQATSAPAGGADTVRWQFLYNQGGGSATTGTQISATYTDTTSVLTTILTPPITVTGSVNIRINRVALNALDTYAADVRLRAIVIRRLA